MNNQKLSIDFKKLRLPLPVKWRVQSSNEKAAVCVAYIDARDAMDRLDDVVGPANWQRDHKEIKGQMYCGVAVKCNGEWSWKWDNGSESNQDPSKGEASDSFKRACVNWGLGRFLYDLPIVKTKTIAREYKGKTYHDPADDSGQKIWDLSKHINRFLESSKKPLPENRFADMLTAIQDNKFSIEEAFHFRLTPEQIRLLIQNA